MWFVRVTSDIPDKDTSVSAGLSKQALGGKSFISFVRDKASATTFSGPGLYWLYKQIPSSSASDPKKRARWKCGSFSASRERKFDFRSQPTAAVLSLSQRKQSPTDQFPSQRVTTSDMTTARNSKKLFDRRPCNSAGIIQRQAEPDVSE